ncbi:NADH dehydrogenase [Cryptococcus wingfieldii CBS 7118]|uniref:NADH dehydrogenase n=1 Tax=Cryptococcus wingfieldii CBS 7118 TaxID=1295528 RepID=A0A1E3J0D8_9TREE|nr:NADH dehydrogenase [Cryptococcus wingfieldii CBS 7118]ODN94304.1 NADH dehydrogenase [Cryptococcus wingfieldii CBS 7118]
MLPRRLASTVSVPPTHKSPRKIVLVGAGFLGSYVAKALIADPRNRIQIVSRHPEKRNRANFCPVHNQLKSLGNQILAPSPIDITSPSSVSALRETMSGAAAVVSMGGLLTGTEAQMKALQEDGVRRVAEAAKEEGVGRVVGVSAIGAHSKGATAYWRTKGKGEEAIWENHPSATIIRPSILFGPVFTYREIMELVLRFSGLQRPILSIPYALGALQGFFLEKLPENIFTLTRDQVTQLRDDNIVSPVPPMFSQSFEAVLKAFPSSAPSSAPPGDAGLRSVEEILPQYLGPKQEREEGKRTHGRQSASFEEVKSMGQK